MENSVVSYSRAWFWASRPFSLSAAVVPVLVGSALAADEVRLDWLLFSFALAGSIAIQIGTNLTDEYVDHRRGGEGTKYPAPHKVIQRGLLSGTEVLVGCIVAFGAGVGMGLYIVSQVGWPILAVGMGSVVVAVLYSAGPRPIGDIGLGEITVFFFMGPLMVLASYYVQTKNLSWHVFWASMPVAFLVTAILQCNNLRDAEEDRRSGKRTLVTMLGVGFGRWGYVGLLAASYVSLVVAAAVDVLPLAALVGLGSLPWALVLVSRVWKARERREMSLALVNTAKLHARAGLLMAAGLLGHVVFG
ncbi:MAG: 1,4-dihydroxy-2-naphthoate octaprenyltransferase [Dehalococcoidia bacterium]